MRLIHDKKIILFIALLAAALIALSFWPVTERRILSFGTDTFKAHYPLFANRTLSQKIHSQGELLGVGVIAIDHQHSGQLKPLDVTITSTDGTIVRNYAIAPNLIKDDTFAWIKWSEPLSSPDNTWLISFFAPQAEPTTAIGIRFDQNSQDIALGLIEKAPLWHSSLNALQRSLDRDLIIQALGLTVGLALCFYLVSSPILPASHRRRLKYGCLLLIIVCALLSRIIVVRQFGGVSGGDPYNYLFITERLVNGGNPFEGIKRLPGYPFLLIPAFLTSIDDIRYMQGLSIVSAGVTLLLITLLSYRLQLPWSVQILTLTLLAWQKDFFLTSIRPEPYSFYTALLLTALLLFFYLDRVWAQWLFSFTLGYAAMTRQEGFVLALVLGVCTLVYYRTSLCWSGYSRAFLPALCLVLPFFIHNTQSFGNPFFTPYFEGDRLQIVDSWGSFKDSVTATGDILSSMWKPSWNELTHVPWSSPLFLTGISIVLLFWCVSQWQSQPSYSRLIFFLSTFLLLVLAVLFWLRFSNKGLFDTIIIHGSSGALLASLIPFLWHTRWKGAVIVSVLLSQMMIATWFHPFAKHFSQDYPLLLLILVTGLTFPWHRAQHATHFTLPFLYLCILLPFTIMTLTLFSKIGPQLIDRHNQSVALDSVVYRAVNVARSLSGPHGFDQGYLPARLYFPDNAYYYEGEGKIPFAEQIRWLKDHSIQTLVITTDRPYFQPPLPNWQTVATFKAENKEEELTTSTVYRIPSYPP